ncbi:AT hook motif family protein [Verticillium alfalfae VaMs.102]|uniref:AT hook motif family protein n=1 Tax=Verticillium alfalfae (strain VaMs.102 / ATCC MYA-4576 / FGSC 10136) TaxID=526221 RepID=C9SS84_VERA1|nr:AT hook motif family protein [Verticillium alfalfae VaMs.102]EEY21649.1 AT hook motif family protein [Verticillium alfalfae VaMs.102]
MNSKVRPFSPRKTRSQSRRGTPQGQESSAASAITPAVTNRPNASLVIHDTIKLLPEKLSANVTRLSSVGHGILLKKHLWLRQYSASGVAGAIARGLRADATLVFGQEEAGTAICVDSSGILMTCAHCVAEVEDELDLESSHWLVFESGQIVEAKCVAWDGRRDLALLKVVAAQGMPGPQVSGGPKSSSQRRCDFPCALPDTSSPPLNDVLVCVGHPGSEDLESDQPGVATGYDVLVMSEGRFRGCAEGQDPQDNEKIGALKHDCWTYWGHSGAPLFRKRSKLLVGLHSSWDDVRRPRASRCCSRLSWPCWWCCWGSGSACPGLGQQRGIRW